MIKVVSATLLAALAFSASAQTSEKSDKGFYLGADGGKTFNKYSQDDTSLGIFGGYQFNSNFAVEAGHRRLGNHPAGIPYQHNDGHIYMVPTLDSTTSTSLAAIGSIPVTKDLKVFGRLGMSHLTWKLEDYSESRNKTLLGVGASYSLAPNVDVRLEYQRNAGNIRNLSAGFSYKF